MTDLLTDLERRALDLTGELAGLFGEIVGPERSRGGDLAEIVNAIHLLQRYLMSQAAARAFPSQYRALGELIDTTDTEDEPILPQPPWSTRVKHAYAAGDPSFIQADLDESAGAGVWVVHGFSQVFEDGVEEDGVTRRFQVRDTRTGETRELDIDSPDPAP